MSAITREKTIKLWLWDRVKCPYRKSAIAGVYFSQRSVTVIRKTGATVVWKADIWNFCVKLHWRIGFLGAFKGWIQLGRQCNCAKYFSPPHSHPVSTVEVSSGQSGREFRNALGRKFCDERSLLSSNCDNKKEVLSANYPVGPRLNTGKKIPILE